MKYLIETPIGLTCVLLTTMTSALAGHGAAPQLDGIEFEPVKARGAHEELTPQTGLQVVYPFRRFGLSGVLACGTWKVDAGCGVGAPLGGIRARLSVRECRDGRRRACGGVVKVVLQGAAPDGGAAPVEH
jgi:hypothetical protein